MLRKLLFILLPVMLLLIWAASPENTNNTPHSEETITTVVDSFDMDNAISALEQSIRGKENMPADSVFSNIRVMKDIPAGRLLKIMKFGFSNSLGVDCNHCHNTADWASEEKIEKQIARDMWTMTRRINEELLTSIPGLSGTDAYVNCTTCHRGQTKPAHQLN